MFIDTHAHLDFDNFDTDRNAVVARARDAGVTTIVNVGTGLASSERAVALAHEFDGLYATVGLHPHDAQTYTPTIMKKFDALAHDEKVVALGEVGLDYFRDHSPRIMQQEVLRAFIALHKKTQLPLIIHARDSYDDVYAILTDELGGSVHGVMHCFSGDEDTLKRFLALGMYISFAGHTTYPKNETLRRLAALVPDERLLIETDSPFLAPQAMRGKRNEPAYITDTAACIAAARNISLEDLGRITTRNAERFFALPQAEHQPEIIYKIRNTAYVNVTRGCTSACVFCPRTRESGLAVKGHNLAVSHEPTVEETKTALEVFRGDCDEICFCGFGEPLLRLDFVIAVASYCKERFRGIPIRIDTNGHGNLIHKRNILPELAGMIDRMSISLNAPDAESYRKIVQPEFEGDVFEEVKAFIREAKKHIPLITVTCLNYPGIDTEKVRHIAEEELSVQFRLRIYDEVG